MVRDIYKNEEYFTQYIEDEKREFMNSFVRNIQMKITIVVIII